MSAADWLAHIHSINPHAHALYVSASRGEFLDAAERLIQRVVERMEGSRATYRKLDERDLSKLVAELLGELVPSEAESHSNGHVDVTIRHPRGLGFSHITECKIWNGASWHREGMKQVLHYVTGHEVRALCLVFFIRHKRMKFLLERLRHELLPPSEPLVAGEITDHHFLPWGFVTPHEHSSGSELSLVHYGCYLWEEGEEDLGEETAEVTS